MMMKKTAKPAGLKSRKLTAFEWEVLRATLTIPLGETRSYQWIAQKIGRPDAVRAVGQALRKNPYPLIIPCHRVVKSDGTLGGYAGRFGPRKGRLLAREQEIKELLENVKPACRQGRRIS